MEGVAGLSSRAAATAASIGPILEFYFGHAMPAGGAFRRSATSPSAIRTSSRCPGWSRRSGNARSRTTRTGTPTRRRRPSRRRFLAEAVGRELGLAFEPADIALTAGAFGAIAAAIRLVLDPGDEAIFSVPPWFCYAPMLLAADAVPRQVALTPGRFDLDLAAVEAAIGPRTRLVIVNTPHNPTGRIYGRDELAALAELLDRASARIGRRIYMLSDEPYRRIRFDGRGFTSPAAIYPWTLIAYSYGKVLLAPGQRLGYLAVSPLMPQAGAPGDATASPPCRSPRAGASPMR